MSEALTRLLKELADDAEHLVNILERKAEEEWDYEYVRQRIKTARRAAEQQGQKWTTN